MSFFDLGNSSFIDSANQFLDPIDLFGARAKQSADEQMEAGEEASDAMLTANESNIEFQKWLFDEQTALQEPWLKAGQEAITRIESTPDFSFTPEDFSNFLDPSYDFRLEQGVKAMDSSASARGNLFSGAQAKQLQEYGQDMASQEYSNAFSRMQTANTNAYNQAKSTYDTNLNTDKAMAGVGQNSAGSIQNAGQAMGSAVGSSITEQGNILAQQQIQNANISAQAQAQQTSNTSNAVGSAIGIASLFSDERLKDNLVFIEEDNGHKVYSWNWNKEAIALGITSKEKGVIAQEVMIYMPEAISKQGNYYQVDYSQLGLKDENYV